MKLKASINGTVARTTKLKASEPCWLPDSDQYLISCSEKTITVMN